MKAFILKNMNISCRMFGMELFPQESDLKVPAWGYYTFQKLNKPLVCSKNNQMSTQLLNTIDYYTVFFLFYNPKH